MSQPGVLNTLRGFGAANRSSSGALRLWLYGLGMLLPLVAFTWRYPLGPHALSLTDIGKLSGYGRAEFAGFVVGLAALFGLYLLALHESQRLGTREALPIVFTCATLMAAAMALMYPTNAIDIYLYAVRSRLWTSYGANPLSAFPADFPADVWFHFSGGEWAGRGSPYGPLWNLLAAPITWAAGDRILLALLGFKALAIAALLGGGWAIARALAASGTGSPTTGAICYLWNPLVLWEGIGNGHNDVVLVLPVLLALWAWAARRDRLVIPLLVAATLIKYVAAPLVVLAAIALWRRAAGRGKRRALLAWSLSLSLAVATLALFPFYDLAAARASLADQGGVLHTSPQSVAVALLNDHYPAEAVRSWAALLGAGAVYLALCWHAGVVWRRPEHLARACFEVLFVLVLVGLGNARPWYVIWLVGIAALLPWGWPAWRAIAWSSGALAGYGFFIWVEAWWQPGYDAVQTIGVALMLAGTLALTAAEIGLAATQRHRHSSGWL